MCAITGIVGNNMSTKLYDMLLALKHRGPDKSGAFVDNKVIYGNLKNGNLKNFKIPTGSIGLGQNLLSIVGNEVVQPLKEDNLVIVCNGEIYNYLDLKKVLKQESNYNFKTNSDSEVILALLSEYYRGSLKESILKLIPKLDGDYAIAAYDGKDLVAVRDPVGVKPLYYGSNKEYFGFASERKALWKVGINETDSLPPNYMLHNQKLVPLPERFSWKLNYSKGIFNVNEDNLKAENKLKTKNNLKAKDKLETKDDLKNILKDYLIKSVEKRIRGLEKVGIPFSGGVDSTILAVLCNDLGVETELYTVGSEGSPDLNFAEKAADHMHLPLHIKMVDEQLVREYTPLVLNAIEEWNVMKLGVGMTTYLAAEMGHENGLRVMLSGQGADELFGGYHRYHKFYHDKGEDAQKDLMNDVENLYHVNLERDDKVTMANSVELRVPYLDIEIINRAMKIPMKYKINGEDDRLRKCILREVALDIGVPQEIVERPKKAAQYGSGIHKILKKKVLKDQGYMADLKNSFKFIDI
jgi:asparagine synthase (glutamine-hydrolysing)